MQLEILKEKPETEIGGYFVSNYPPFSVWTPDHVPDAIAALDRTPAPGTPLGLYIHIPFCRKRCHFCYFRVYTDKNSRDIDDYMAALAKEIGLYAGRPFQEKREFNFVYFGGGTPSYLSSDQLLRLVERVNRHWQWDQAEEVTFECEPGTLKKNKLKTIRRIGTTRLSLGVEHLDDEVLELNGRAHHSLEIFQAYEWAREVGFEQINIDLIAGMLGETEEKWRLTVERALAMAPDSLTIYQMEVPHNTTIAKETRGARAVATPVAAWAMKRRWVDEAFQLFEDAGYEVSSAYTVVKRDGHSGFRYRDALWHGSDMVGAGVASFGHVGGVHLQNKDRWEDYLAEIETGRLPLARALPLSDRQRMIREWVLQLKTGRAARGYFVEKFGEDPVEVFGEALSLLEKEGLAYAENSDITLTRKGLLQADRLLSLFFEPQFRDVRYA